MLSAADKPAFLAHLLRLDTETRRNRFSMIASDLFLAGYTETTFSLDTTILAYEEDGLIRAVGELRALRHPDPDIKRSEAAFCVEARFRQRGIGALLMELVLLEARATDISQMYINCLATNRKMQALARAFGADLALSEAT